jgi:NAD(P)-dependent dehydrogenase (short-subunit alcohol dehydrogenase family)
MARNKAVDAANPVSRKWLASALSLKRIADPDEIAAAIVFLAGPAASYVTGAKLDANGGYNA